MAQTMPKYYLVQADLLPEIFIKVMKAKKLLQTGECGTVGDAVARVGISRSAFYKYKDAISPFQDLQRSRILTFQVMLRDQTGLLSMVLSVFARCGGNILTINGDVTLEYQYNCGFGSPQTFSIHFPAAEGPYPLAGAALKSLSMTYTG